MVIEFYLLEELLRIFVALVHYPDHVGQTGIFKQGGLQMDQIVIDVRNVSSLQHLHVEHSLDVEVASDLLMVDEGLLNLRVAKLT